MGMYRDEGLGVIYQTSGITRERLKTKIIKAIKYIGFKITIEIGSDLSKFF